MHLLPPLIGNLDLLDFQDQSHSSAVVENLKRAPLYLLFCLNFRGALQQLPGRVYGDSINFNAMRRSVVQRHPRHGSHPSSLYLN